MNATANIAVQNFPKGLALGSGPYMNLRAPSIVPEWILVLSHQAMNWSQCLLKLVAHPVTSVRLR